MFGRRKPFSLVSGFHPAEFDPELCAEVIARIEEKSTLRPPESTLLGVNITNAIGHILCSFEDGFIDEINTRVGNANYGIIVFLSHDNKNTL